MLRVPARAQSTEFLRQSRFCLHSSSTAGEPFLLTCTERSESALRLAHSCRLPQQVFLVHPGKAIPETLACGAAT